MRPQKKSASVTRTFFSPCHQAKYIRLLKNPRVDKDNPTVWKGSFLQRHGHAKAEGTGTSVYQPYQYFTAVTNSHRYQDILCCQMVLLFCSTCCAFFFRSEHICCDFFQYPFFLPCNLGCEEYKAINQSRGEGKGSDFQRG